MHDRDQDDAPVLGAAGQVSAGFEWPPPEEWPDDDASTLEWARFYLHRCHLHDLRPTYAQADRDERAVWLAGEAKADWRWAHKGAEVPPDVAAQIFADAKAMGDAERGPIARIAGEMRGRGVTTDADLVRWFEPLKNDRLRRTEHHPDRGVCCLLGPGTSAPTGWNTQIDIDPRRGGAIMGGLADTPGPRVCTPRGGLHIFLRAEAGRPAYHSDGALAPGVEVRTSGWALLPAGRATRSTGASDLGRRWIGKGAPVAPPPELLRPAPRVARPGVTAGAGGEPIPDGAGGALGRVAAMVVSSIGRGDGRTAVAQAIVGMLARTEGLPTDFVDACTAMLVEYGAGHDWDDARIREECTRWRLLLTRGPRNADFAAEVLVTWQAVRDQGPTFKGAAWARMTALSIWKTADRREEGRAGAEDLGHAGDVADYPAPASAPSSLYGALASMECVAADVPITPVAAGEAVTPVSPIDVRASDYVLHGPLCACGQCKVAAVEAKDAEQVKREAFLRRILPFSADAYGDDIADWDMERVPLRIDALYPFRDFWGVCEETPEDSEWAGVVPGHGYGQHLARAVGGLLPGSMIAVGGAGAKIGKTHFVGQGVEGLGLDAAARILGMPGYQDKPIVMITWITEMPKPGEVKYRMLARLFGFDAAALASSAAPEAPGIIHMAERAQAATGRMVTPTLVVEHARRIVRAFRSADEVPSPKGGHEKNPVSFYLKYLQTEVCLSAFPAPTGQGRSFVDQASGVNLIGHVADGIMLRRRELAERIGVAEDKITPIVVVDPGQRFIGGGESSKRELDAFLLAVQTRLCFASNGVGAVVIMTSDTTKAAAKDIDLDAFMSEPGPRLAADIFAGSQAFMHIPDTVIAVCSQDGGVPYRRTQYVRVLASRANDAALVFPFSWETFCGRFRPRAPVPLRDPRDRDDRRSGGGGGASGGTRGGNRSWTPQGDVVDHGGDGPRLPPFKRGGAPARYAHGDDK